MKKQKFLSFKEFYPYYLSEHRNPICKIFHFIGTSVVLYIFFYIIYSFKWNYFFLMPISG